MLVVVFLVHDWTEEFDHSLDIGNNQDRPAIMKKVRLILKMDTLLGLANCHFAFSLARRENVQNEDSSSSFASPTLYSVESNIYVLAGSIASSSSSSNHSNYSTNNYHSKTLSRLTALREEVGHFSTKVRRNLVLFDTIQSIPGKLCD